MTPERVECRAEIGVRSGTMRVLAATALLLCLTGCEKDELRAELDRVKGELARSEGENATLKQKVAELEQELSRVRSELEAMGAKYAAAEEELQELRAEQAKREEDLAVYKNLFAKLKGLIDAGTIRVSFRKGRMVVELASAVLFDSGRTKLKPAGEEAIKQLVEALSSVGKRNFLVAGHTDNVPVRQRFSSNWELSTARAVVVVNYMAEQGYPPQQLGAAGYGEFDPVATNDTEEGRQSNRRIEIILMPDLGEIKGLREAIEGRS